MTWVHGFDHRHERPPRELKGLLGGKGANLAEMTSVLGLPVPPGFTITTEACVASMRSGWPDGLDEEVASHVARLEEAMGKRLGDADDPLLVSVRSGAKFSMPGMMDTVLNLGMNDEAVEGLARQTGDERFAYDSYRRFVQMFADVVLGLDAAEFHRRVESARELAGVARDADIPPQLLRYLVASFQHLVEEATGAPFPQDPIDQLRQAIEAVFRSWDTPRAVAYRDAEGIPHDLGTAVNVQAMVFGNRDDRSGTGVAFTRNASTGEQGIFGDFLVNAQGEDVVAGTHRTQDLAELSGVFPEVYDQLIDAMATMERHYRDMLDVEFTIEQGRLWLLQTRVGKRTGAAALRMAVEMVDDPDIGLTREEAVLRITADHLEQVLHPHFEAGEHTVLAEGLAASPGAAVGRVYFTADDAADAAGRGEQVILVRQETSPEDIHGMAAAEGILTTRGGLVSHAAVVARGWGKPAVVGADGVRITGTSFTSGDVVVNEGDVISIDGSTGEVVLGELTLTAAEPPGEFDTILAWADEIRAGGVGVRANADTGDDAARARAFGAEGIGLCRTEHMFLGDDRLPIVREMILTDSEDGERAALEKLRAAQRADFAGVLEAMDGLPVTVRLLDPPLHEFLPDHEELAVKQATEGLSGDDERLLHAVRTWAEENPMLGTRGVRLGYLKPGLYAMQVRALLEAAADRAGAGGRPVLEIMIPLTVDGRELEVARGWVEEVLEEVDLPDGVEVVIGTMVETPRAALRAGDLAGAADFFSFGTNDLTQMTFGFSRDDVQRVLAVYIEQGVLPRSPFETIDSAGVGELVRLGVERGRAARPDLKLGICGEHGGDPDSIRFFVDVGLDYVSCSPFRVPVARLAAAHAVLAARGVAGAGEPD